MIKVFSQADKIFTSNGDKVIQPIRALIHKEDNGAYYLELSTDLSYIDYLVSGNIIVANAPDGEQAFRIGNVEKTRSKITCKCNHVYFDTQNYLIEDSYVVNKNCNDALDHLNNATEPESPFTVSSNITAVDSFRCVRRSLNEAIGVVLERWGGHLVRDNFSIAVNSSIGQDNGVTIRYRKNLQEITCSEDWEDVVTKLLPVGKDGILLNAIDAGASKYVISDIQYDIPYTRSVSFSQDDINEEDYTDASGAIDQAAYKLALVNDLRQQAQEYVNNNSVPKINYTLRAHLDNITDIGDTIVVIDERLGINITTNVIAFEYDCIQKRYVQIEFGNFKETLNGFASRVRVEAQEIAETQASAVQVTLSNELNEATNKIWGALGNSYCIYEGDKILVVDSLPKETARNVLLINNGGIAFSQTGINGTFNSAWTIEGTLNMQNINVINLTANLIKGGTLKLGSKLNESGILEIYDNANNLIGRMDKDGLKMFGLDGSYVLMNNEVGFAGFDRNGNKIYWVSQDEFHMKKSVIEEEITLCGQLRFIAIQITDGNNRVVNEGIGLVSSTT